MNVYLNKKEIEAIDIAIDFLGSYLGANGDDENVSFAADALIELNKKIYKKLPKSA